MRLAKKICILALFAWALVCQAQIGIDLKTDRRNYLPFEPIMLTITISNTSGNTLIFGKEKRDFKKGYVNCIIENEHGRRVRRSKMSDRIFGQTGKVNFATGLRLPAGGRQSVEVAVDRYYVMSQPQGYNLTVYFYHPRLSRAYKSPSINLNVVGGTVSAKRVVGLPAKPGEIIKNRTCSLLSYHGQHTTEYVLKIEDDRKVYAVKRLCQHVGGDKPQFMSDARSQIHVLVQDQPRSFSYWVFDINGNMKQTSVYKYTKADGMPRLTRDPDIGRIMVQGGRLEVPGEEEELDLPQFQGVRE